MFIRRDRCQESLATSFRERKQFAQKRKNAPNRRFRLEYMFPGQGVSIGGTGAGSIASRHGRAQHHGWARLTVTEPGSVPPAERRTTRAGRAPARAGRR